MAATVAESAADDRLLTEAVRAGRPLRARQARAHRRRRPRSFSPGPGHQRHRGADAGTGCYAALLTHKGKMLGDLRVLDIGDELCSTPSARAAGAVRRAAPRRGRLRRRAAQAHARARRCSRSSGPAPRDGRRRPARPPSTPTRRAQLGGADVLLVATDVGVDVVCCAAEDADRVRGALDGGRRPVPEAAAEVAARRVAGARATAWTSTTRRSPRRPASTIAP